MKITGEGLARQHHAHLQRLAPQYSAGRAPVRWELLPQHERDLLVHTAQMTLGWIAVRLIEAGVSLDTTKARH